MNDILATTSGYEFIRKADGTRMGSCVHLGLTYYLGGERLSEPKRELPEDFEERMRPIDELASEAEAQGLTPLAYIREKINERTDVRILSGFRWNGIAVWLSSENQFNYKAAYDLAQQTGGASLPVTFKFGTDDAPVYHTFEALKDLRDFYTAALAFVQRCLSEGWAEKDTINLENFTNHETDA